MNEDAALNAEMIRDGHVVLERRRGRCVEPFFHEWKTVRRSEDMEMHVAGAGR